MDVADIPAIAATEVARCFAVAAERYRRGFASPQLRFDLRGAGAGKAYSRFTLIRLNAALLARGGAQAVIAAAAHEAAHLIAHALYGPRRIRPHGAEWQNVMRTLGQEPVRTHALDTTGLVRRQRRYAYTCGCASDGATTHEMSAVRHGRVHRGHWYRCMRCGTRLTAVAACVPSEFARTSETRERKRHEVVELGDPADQ